MSDAPDEEFTVAMHSNDADVLVVSLEGELDMSEVSWVEDTLAAAAPHHRRMDLCLDKLTFIDSTGIRTLLALRQRAQVLNIDLRLREPSSAVERALKAAGLSKILDCKQRDDS